MARQRRKGRKASWGKVVAAVGLLGAIVLIGGLALDLDLDSIPVISRENAFRATLTGFQEVPPILTEATGEFRARLTGDGRALEFELTYENLSSPATVAHLHFGQRGVNGPIFAFLCGGGGKPACPEFAGTITGTIQAADIQGIPDQGLAEGDFAGALRILREEAAYANVHTNRFPAGEIRGQVRPSRR